MTTIIKGFFFDLDGTLVNTHESNYRAYRDAIKDVTNVEMGDELKSRIMRGEPSKTFLPALLPDADASQVDAINKRKKEAYPSHLHLSDLNEYLSTFLEQMSEHYITVLVTTAKKANAEAVLDTHDIGGLFNYKIYGEDVSAMKPDPEAYLLALNMSGLSPDEVIAFEDSEKGIQAATNAGIKTIHIRNFND
jgi:beta-phosphoglucomutase